MEGPRCGCLDIREEGSGLQEQHHCGTVSQLICDRPWSHTQPRACSTQSSGKLGRSAGEGPGLRHTRLCSQGSFPYEALGAYQRCVDNPTRNCELGALSHNTSADLTPQRAEFPLKHRYLPGRQLVVEKLIKQANALGE
jgi:hypothetical protein